MSNASDFIKDSNFIYNYVGDVEAKEITVPKGIRRMGHDIGFDSSAVSTVRHELDCFPMGMKAEKLTLSQEFEKLGSGVLRGFKKLQNISVPEGNVDFYDVDGVLFNNCDMIDPATYERTPRAGRALVCYPQGRKGANYTIPDGTTEIFEGAFFNCKKLKSISVPDSVKKIGSFAFLKCAELISIKALGVTEIGNVWGSQKKASVIKPLICPKVALSKVSNKELKICLAMGFLCESELYAKRTASSYEKYIDENKPLILAEAQRHNVEAVVQLLGEGTEPKETASVITIKTMSVAEAKELFHTSKKATGVKINYYLGNEDIIDIPSAIGKTEVALVSKDAFRSTAVIRCTPKLFSKLPAANQAATYLAYINKAADFPEDQIHEMKRFVNKKALHLASYAVDTDNEQLLAYVFENAKPLTIDEILELRSHIKENVQINAILMDYENRHYSCDDISEKQQDNAEKAAGLRELSLSDWKKLYSLYEAPYGEGYIITKYKGKDPHVIIPDIINGLPVIGIEYPGFSKCTSVESIVVSDNVQSVCRYAFSKCKNLKKIVLGRGISTIPMELFESSTALCEVVLPDTLQSIESCAFWHCDSMTALKIPESVKFIDRSAFSASNITIHAPAKSYAEQYAKENNIPFEAI